MKRGTPRHPKVLELASILKIPRYAAVGLLEMLWHFTAEFAHPGDIGRFKNTAIASALDYTDDPGELIRALTVCGWVDPCECHRLRVHDWQDHADQTVQRVLAKRNQEFLPCYDDKETGFLYLAQQESKTGPVKIGWSENPQSRIDDLQTSSPHPISLLAVIPGSRADEAALHAHFKDQNLHREWFRFSESIMLAFKLADDKTETGQPIAFRLSPIADSPSPTPKANTPREPARPNRKTFEYPADFEAFWIQYPKHRRTEKQITYKEWVSADKKGLLPDLQIILNTLMAQKKSPGWTKDDGQWVIKASKWIKGACWDDEIDTTVRKTDQPDFTKMTASEQQYWRNRQILERGQDAENKPEYDSDDTIDI